MGRYNNRATHPLNFTIKGMMKHDIKSGRYIIEEDGVTYSMEMEEIRNLGDYYNCFITGAEKYPTLERWYRDLPNETKKKNN